MIRRKTPLRRLSLKRQQSNTRRQWNSTLPRPTKKIKAKKRTPSEFARIYGSRGRVAWIKAQPCLASARQKSRTMYAHTFHGNLAYWHPEDRRVYCVGQGSTRHDVLVKHRSTVLRRNAADYRRDVAEGMRREREEWGCVAVRIPE